MENAEAGAMGEAVAIEQPDDKKHYFAREAAAESAASVKTVRALADELTAAIEGSTASQKEVEAALAITHAMLPVLQLDGRLTKYLNEPNYPLNRM